MEGRFRYDVVLIALADIQQDARTLNLARTLSKQFKVAVVGMVGGTQSTEERFDTYPVEVNSGSALTRSLTLRRYVKSGVDLSCRVVGAMDLFAGPACLTLSKKHHANIVYDAREFYFALASLVDRGITQKLVGWFERYLVSRSAAITVSGWLDAEIVAKQYGLLDLPTVILNSPPLARPFDSSRFRDEFDIPEHLKIVVYQGVVLKGRGIEPFLRALPHIENVVLCVIGSGTDVERLQSISNELGIADRVFWKGAVPYSELHGWTCSADVGLCLIEPVSLSYEYALPNKFFEYMMAGIPSLISDLPALHAFVKDYPVGMLVERDLGVSDIVNATRSTLNVHTYAAMKDQCKHVEQFCYERQQSTALDTYYHASI